MIYTEDCGYITITEITEIDLPCEIWLSQPSGEFIKLINDITVLPYTIYDILAPRTYAVLLKNTNKQAIVKMIVKGTESVGRYFDNYKGIEVLTVDDIKNHFLKNVPIDRDDSTISRTIKSAVTLFESEMKFNITPKKVVTYPTPEMVQGIDYDLEDDPYPLATTLLALTVNKMRYAPILSLEKVLLFSRTGVLIRDLTSWCQLDKRKGKITIFPQVGKDGDTQTSSAFGIAGQLFLSGFHLQYDNALRLYYTCGMNVDLLPDIYYQIIGMITAVLLLIPVSEEIRLGWSSVSVSIDGISQSISTPQGLLYAERVKEYKEYISEFFKHGRPHFKRQI